MGTLADLPALALAASIGPPATLVVGKVVALAGELVRPDPVTTSAAR